MHTPQLRRVSIAYPNPRRGGGGRRDRYTYVHGATTILALGLLFNVAGIGVFCWLIFTLIVYALPFVVGLTAGMAAFHGGAGVIGALVVGVAVGALWSFVSPAAGFLYAGIFSLVGAVLVYSSRAR